MQWDILGNIMPEFKIIRPVLTLDGVGTLVMGMKNKVRKTTQEIKAAYIRVQKKI